LGDDFMKGVLEGWYVKVIFTDGKEVSGVMEFNGEDTILLRLLDGRWALIRKGTVSRIIGIKKEYDREDRSTVGGDRVETL